MVSFEIYSRNTREEPRAILKSRLEVIWTPRKINPKKVDAMLFYPRVIPLIVYDLTLGSLPTGQSLNCNDVRQLVHLAAPCDGPLRLWRKSDGDPLAKRHPDTAGCRPISPTKNLV